METGNGDERRTAVLMHASRRRARLHVLSALGDRELLASLGRDLFASPVVKRFLATPLTGSVTLELAEDWGPNSRAEIERVSGLKIVEEPSEHRERLVDSIGSAAHHEAETLTAMLLFSGVAWQMRRGDYLPAALPMFFHGLELVTKRQAAFSGVKELSHELGHD